MPTQFDSHGRPKRCLLLASELVERSRHDLAFDEKIRAKILRAYFKMVREAVLAGYAWYFPDGSKLCVYRERRVGARGVSRYKRGQDGYRVFSYNLKRINEHYSICLEGPMVEKLRYRLETLQELRTDLVRILFNTDRQYRLKDEH